MARMHFDELELDRDVEGGESARQRRGAVWALKRNRSENVVVRVMSCWIAGTGGLLMERDFTGIEAIKPWRTLS